MYTSEVGAATTVGATSLDQLDPNSAASHGGACSAQTPAVGISAHLSDGGGSTAPALARDAIVESGGAVSTLDAYRQAIAAAGQASAQHSAGSGS